MRIIPESNKSPLEIKKNGLANVIRELRDSDFAGEADMWRYKIMRINVYVPEVGWPS